MRGSGREFTFFRGKLRLIQPEEHKVSVDLVVFLSRVKGIKRNSKVADLGAGFGFLSIVLAKRYGVKVHAFERDKRMIELLKRNIDLNGLHELVIPVECDVRNVRDLFGRSSFDVVVTNPPFFPYGKGDNIRSEGDTTLRDFLEASSYLLRDGGYLNLLLPAFRLHEAFLIMEGLNLTPRFLTILYPKVSKPGRLAVITSIRNVPGPLQVERPVLINTPEGRYTEEVESLLEGFL